ncbi:hypothetical protein B0H17DRAFT_1162089 [Mycena rosella]|uniref:CxC1-like cysteine cluster associated with KDZ transposases domain-containing protein n=1 Tax=Mycena rosella TaxID=1033263 RepID=A0AAD7G6K7_MYCRO|nr:hypothetical protein B0H17DRAFT_1162089 [Mycena rosella]
MQESLDCTARLDSDRRWKLEKMCNIADDSTDSFENEPQDVFPYNDVLDGNVHIEISHAGGELDDLQDNLNQELNGKKQQSIQHAYALIPCAPWKPTLAIAARVLKLYHVACLHCPTSTLSDVQAQAFKPYQVQQFTICFDLYLEILQNMDAWVKKALGRDVPDWQVKNCCPACTYKLEGEDKLIFEMLATCDGNDSLKRVLRKEQGVFDDNGVPKRGGAERPDPRMAGAGDDYYFTWERVNRWLKEVLAQQAQVPRSNDQEDGQCQERWKKMSEEITARMWSIFNEMGIFLSLCRHGFVPLIADMVKSGELAKYEDTGLGYNIGCSFETNIKNSPLGPKAKRLNLRMLVGSFHGHADNQMCQLRYLVTYILGLRIEDLEGCERYFSRSNALARICWYASVYHQKQAIATYAAHVDTFEMYANLSTFLVKNYEQSLAILETEKSLQFMMAQAGISGRDEFVRWLEEEKTYLRGLSKEPEVETQQMDYYQRLEDIRQGLWGGLQSKRDSQETCTKKYDKVHNAVQEMEETLRVEARWTADGPEWNTAELVLKRLFELTKMNMSQTGECLLLYFSSRSESRDGAGYKLRKHISKALQKLTWAEVVEYTFLSDFDILWDPTGNAALRDWATQGGRQLMDSFFRIERAKEEIPRLNIEIRRLITYIRDERIFFLAKEAEIIQTDLHLAHFIWKYSNQRGRFDNNHMAWLRSMKKKLGSSFTRTLEPGVRRAEAAECDVEEEMDVDSDVDEAEAAAVEAEIAQGQAMELNGQVEEEWEDVDSDKDDEGEVVEAETLAEMAERVLTIATDA